MGNSTRFGGLVRVSTERQEQQGESLVVQRKAIERDVAKLGGTIAGWYGGQEHATAGWERKEVDRLIADAVKGRFDAVIVAYDDRWSRDNAKSKEGLEAFRQNRIRCFVGTQERNLRSPQDIFFLGMTAEVGEFVAGVQNKKSIESRIERARKGWPAAGALPFGRTFDRDTKQWGLDPDRHAMIREAAARYLAGESLPGLAREYGVNHANLCKVFRERSGDTWVQEFNYPRFDIDEKVITVIPELLPPRDDQAATAPAGGQPQLPAQAARVKVRLPARRARLLRGLRLLPRRPPVGRPEDRPRGAQVLLSRSPEARP
jgi:DNA invertase Pin-like site-specific DNA recombinase